jgi:phosphoglucosamine mutase
MFGTSGIRGRFRIDVTATLAVELGQAIAINGADRIVVGRDPRTTGALLADAVSAGARECGADVIDVGLASTPTIARSVSWQDADAGVSVTASHNPPEDNGLKCFTPSGMAFDESRRERLTELLTDETTDSAAWDEVGAVTTWNDAVDRHRRAIVESCSMETPPEVVVDLGNGAGTVTAGTLRELGCSVTTLNADPDGHFPARPSEPTEETTTALQAQVAETDATLGIAHDGDADRMLAVDETGAFVGGDQLLALFAREAVSEGDRVAVPINTSLVVDDVVEGAGGTVTRTRVGDVFVAERATEADVVFGGEPSGAWIWPGETLAPDGALAACKLAALVSRGVSLEDLVAELPSYPIARESIEVEDKHAVAESVATLAADRYETVTRIDGVRVETDRGWFLIRASGTQPLIRLTAQGRSDAKTEALFDNARNLLEDAIEQS